MTKTRIRSFGNPREQALFFLFVPIDEVRQTVECLSRVRFIPVVQSLLYPGKLASNPSMLLHESPKFISDIVAKTMQRRKVDILFDRHMRLECGREEQEIIQRHPRPAAVDGSQYPIVEVTELLVLRRNSAFLTAHSHAKPLIVGKVVLIRLSGHDRILLRLGFARLLSWRYPHPRHIANRGPGKISPASQPHLSRE